MTTINEMHLIAARDVVSQLTHELAQARKELREAERRVQDDLRAQHEHAKVVTLKR